MTDTRSSLTSSEVEAFSQRIADRIVSLLSQNAPRSVHIYNSNPNWNEVDTAGLIARLRATTSHFRVTVGQGGKDAPLPNGIYDAIIVPLLAFDDDLHRVGFGGGWYDRFLAGQPAALKIGLAYDFQHVDDARAEPHDIPMTHVVTPHGVVTAN